MENKNFGDTDLGQALGFSAIVLSLLVGAGLFIYLIK